MPSPASSKRRRTTSSAASFSATNSTVLPLASAAAIRFVMGWDLPVSRWTFDNKILPTKRMYEGAVLRAVGVPDEKGNVLCQLGGINGILFRKSNVGVL